MNNITVRASSLPGLFDCPARFEATQIRGLRSPQSGRAALGRAVHASTAVYDSARLMGDYDLTPDEAAGAAVDVIKNPEEETLWDDSLKPKEAEKIALDLHGLYCHEIAPKAEYMAVELNCGSLTISDLNLTLTGTLDRIYKTGDDFGIADIKTSSRAVAADGTVSVAGHAWQLGVYELLAQETAVLPITAPAKIIGLQTGKTAKGQRAAEGTVSEARKSLVGEPDAPGVLEMAAHMLHSATFFGNPRSMMCHEKYCPIYLTCKYRR